MLKNCCRKLLVYASGFASEDDERLQSVNAATERIARLLDLDMEIVTMKEKFESIYVYYKNGDEEPIPVFHDKGDKRNIQEICATLRNMMFVLSFHPKHSALRQARKEIMQFS